MKKLLIVALFALAFCFTASAQGFYAGIDAGYGMWTLDNMGTEFETSNTSVALNLGQSVSAFRWEGSLGFTLAADDDGVEYSNMNVMANFYYDFKVTDAIAVYPTAGAGLVISTIDDNGIWDDSQMTFAWQIGAGARFNISQSQSIDLTARYINVGEPEYNVAGSSNVAPVETSAIHLALGYKYWF